MLTSPASPTSLHRPYDEAPARACFRASAETGGNDGNGGTEEARATRDFEVVSRGDFVPGRLALPTSGRSGARPLVLLLHATGSGALDDALDFADEWVRHDLAVARIDLPLHGARQSPKLSERLFGGYRRLARGDALDLDTRALVEEFARQSTSDVLRTVEALGALDEIDATRVAWVGLSGVGAAACAWAAAEAEGLRACVIAGGVGSFPDRGLDPAARLAASGARLEGTAFRLFSGHDEVPTASVDALAEAIPGACRRDSLEKTREPFALGDADAQSIRAFLSEALA